jgi:hypothetical protein
MKRQTFEYCRVVFLGVLACVLFWVFVCFLAVAASGAEPNLRQRVQVTVGTTNGDGVYLGSGIVAVGKHVTQGSLGVRASGSAGAGTVLSEGRGRGVGLIKLDNLPTPSPKCGTRSYYRQVPSLLPAR